MIKRYSPNPYGDGFMTPNYEGEYLKVDELRIWMLDQYGRRVKGKSHFIAAGGCMDIVNELFKELK